MQKSMGQTDGRKIVSLCKLHGAYGCGICMLTRKEVSPRTLTTYNDAIDLASELLERTAADYDQMYVRAMQNQRPTQMERFERMAMSEKAKLLRGQAMHIRKLKK